MTSVFPVIVTVFVSDQFVGVKLTDSGLIVAIDVLSTDIGIVTWWKGCVLSLIVKVPLPPKLFIDVVGSSILIPGSPFGVTERLTVIEVVALVIIKLPDIPKLKGVLTIESISDSE